MTDNFYAGSSGNLVGQIDLDSGLIKRVVGVILEQSEVTVHPDTKEPLKDFILPHWRDIVKVCLTAAAAFPGLRFQHWDIAICSRGPVILELNSNGGLAMAHLAHRSGIYDAQFGALLSGLCR